MSGLTSGHLGPGYGTRVLRLGDKHLYPLNHFVGPMEQLVSRSALPRPLGLPLFELLCSAREQKKGLV